MVNPKWLEVYREILSKELGPKFLELSKEDLVCIIEKLLADKTILVAGSAIQAFEEVCPERIDLIHKNYRKLCNLLIDVDEWGQVVIISMLTRYARNQFLNPYPASEANKEVSKPKLDEDKEEKDEDEDDYDSKFAEAGSKMVNIDPDHRLLLRVTKPLLQRLILYDIK